MKVVLEKNRLENNLEICQRIWRPFGYLFSKHRRMDNDQVYSYIIQLYRVSRVVKQIWLCCYWKKCVRVLQTWSPRQFIQQNERSREKVDMKKKSTINHHMEKHHFHQPEIIIKITVRQQHISVRMSKHKVRWGRNYRETRLIVVLLHEQC